MAPQTLARPGRNSSCCGTCAAQTRAQIHLGSALNDCAGTQRARCTRHLHKQPGRRIEAHRFCNAGGRENPSLRAFFPHLRSRRGVRQQVEGPGECLPNGSVPRDRECQRLVEHSASDSSSIEASIPSRSEYRPGFRRRSRTSSINRSPNHCTAALYRHSIGRGSDRSIGNDHIETVLDVCLLVATYAALPRGEGSLRIFEH